MNNKRTVISIIRGVWIRLLSILIPFTFPAYLTSFLHRLRGVIVGSGTKINRSVQIDDTYPESVNIGKNVWITAGVMILCHQRDLKFYNKDFPVMQCPLEKKEVIIKDNAHIGIGAIILPGVTIGKGAVIGAGAVVDSDIPDYSLAVGVPAKVIKSF